MLAVFGLAFFVVIWVLSIFAGSVTGDAAALVPVIVTASAVDFGAVVDKLEVRRVGAAAVVHLLHHLIEVVVKLCKQGLSCRSTRGAQRVLYSSATGSLMVRAVSVIWLRWGSLRGVHEAGAFVASRLYLFFFFVNPIAQVRQ